MSLLKATKMKSAQHDTSGDILLISRKKTQKTSTIIFSMMGFLLFLTGGLVVLTAVIDGLFNTLSASIVAYIAAGAVAYKLGRYIMKSCAVSVTTPKVIKTIKVR